MIMCSLVKRGCFFSWILIVSVSLLLVFDDYFIVFYCVIYTCCQTY